MTPMTTFQFMDSTDYITITARYANTAVYLVDR